MYAFLINKTTKHKEKLKKKIFCLNNLLIASTSAPVRGWKHSFSYCWLRMPIKNSPKICTELKIVLSLQRFWDDESLRLGLSYGVMVALQFLVLPVLVRIRVRQHKRGAIQSNCSSFCMYLRLHRPATACAEKVYAEIANKSAP